MTARSNNPNNRRQRKRRDLRIESLQKRELMAGDLDPTFGFGWGATLTDFGGNEMIQDMAVQSDGKVIVAGHTTFGGSGKNVALARYNIDGSLDVNFGSAEGVLPAGAVATDFDNNDNNARALEVLEDGSILVAVESNQTDTYEIALVKYTANGELDATFGEDGRVTIESGTNDRLLEMDLANGKIVLLSETRLRRLNLDGSADTGFGGGDGVVNREDVLPHGFEFRSLSSRDGNYAVGLWVEQFGGVNVLMLNSDGSKDTTYGADGVASHDDNDAVNTVSSLAIQPDGKVVALSVSGRVVRFDADGLATDSDFHVDGVVDLSPDLTFGRSLTLETDGSITLAGKSGENGATVVRLTSNGGMDSSFSSDGVMHYGAGTLEAAADYAEGKLVLAGTAFGDFFLMRLTGDEYVPMFEGFGGFQGSQGGWPGDPQGGRGQTREVGRMFTRFASDHTDGRDGAIHPDEADLRNPMHLENSGLRAEYDVDSKTRQRPSIEALDQFFAEIGEPQVGLTLLVGL